MTPGEKTAVQLFDLLNSEMSISLMYYLWKEELKQKFNGKVAILIDEGSIVMMRDVMLWMFWQLFLILMNYPLMEILAHTYWIHTF